MSAVSPAVVTGIPGRATAEGTRRFADRGIRDRKLPPEHFRTTAGGLSVSSLGLGTYLGNPDGPTDVAVEQAVALCLTSGRVNVLDTAINYRYQRAERSVGRALHRAFERAVVQRDEVFVSTKIGYLAPDAESSSPVDRWVATELVVPGILDPADVVDGSHAMSPSYLEDQFRRSRTNLDLDAIDLLYLHNAPDAQLSTVGEPEFRKRLEAAFEVCEGFRSAGQLGAYGLATWDSLRVPPGAEGHFGLRVAVQVAEKIGGAEHGFRFVQFPFNQSMPEAATWPTQLVGRNVVPLFDAAVTLGIGCFTSVPLLQGRLTRGKVLPDGLTAAQTALQFARSAPGNLTALVGQKKPEHLSENLDLASRPPWSESEFRGRLT
ncbi:MAG: aldo/keto reductase [Thermoplasmata archaeon]|nr:aldo/keto reductase [Thermoplasmata archaeon]